ncbi:unnamed protein product [Didymodactylos carnosus]|uniref:Uncharacterized protein n=1 Tax=Didymodactylos carnosus TaxID=1234261 RepID=A0A815IND3_9BILA|nr:unnamed protein product [Didymodactylos carnosus]CAF4257517.1 unnamed protein product [Didymodactylos carnosus]
MFRNIVHLTLQSLSMSHLLLLFNYIPMIQYLDVTVEQFSNSTNLNFFSISSSMVLYLINLKLNLISRNISFTFIQSFLKKFSKIQQFSFVGCDIDYIDGLKWENVLSSLLYLKIFYLRIEILEVPLTIDINEIYSKFSTNYWFKHQWFIICDYSSNNEFELCLYTIPYSNSIYYTTPSTLKTISTTNNSLLMTKAYDKINKLIIFDDINLIHRKYSNIEYLTLYTKNYNVFLSDLIDLSKLKHSDIYDNVNCQTFLEILNRTSNISSLEFGYDHSLLSITHHVQSVSILNKKKIKKLEC